MAAKLEDGLLVLTMPKIISEENATVIPIQYTICFTNIFLFLCNMFYNFITNFIIIYYIFSQALDV